MKTFRAANALDSKTFKTHKHTQSKMVHVLLLLNFASEYAIRKFQESQVGLKLNGTHELFAYADDVNL
jgi:hypothetical protein